MTRQQVHRRFLSCLLSLRDEGLVGKVRIVARLYNDEFFGSAAVAPAYVFLPDMHLVTRETQEAYKFGFLKLEPGLMVERDRILFALARRVRDLRRELGGSRNLRTILLGDFLDIWREDNRRGEDVEGMTRRILDEFPASQDLLLRLGSNSLSARLTLGNHELWGNEGVSRGVSLSRARKSHLLKLGNVFSVLVTHGHVFDRFEELLDDDIQEFFLETFGSTAKGREYDLNRLEERSAGDRGGSRGDPPSEIRREEDGELLPDWVNLWVTHEQANRWELEAAHDFLPDVLGYARELRRGSARAHGSLGLEGVGRLGELRAVVIGHSHKARLCLHVDPQDPRQNLVLVDCGAWIERVRFEERGEAVPSCQVAILCGGDVRIYQLDPSPALIKRTN